MNFNCPVCNKAGLQDYTATHIICPQCNSDLKPFLLLHSISKRKSGKIITYVTAGVIVIACVFAFLYFNLHSEKEKIFSDNSKTVQQFQDSIASLHSTIAQIKNIQPENKTSEKNIAISYKVKKGDYPSKIAEFFYNDWKMYKKIEADNNLQQPYTLKVGQILSIKIKQE